MLLLVLLMLGTAEGAPVYPPIDPSSIRRVHLIQSNHLDVGFADYAPNIMNRYLVGQWGTAGPPEPRNKPQYYPAFLQSAANTSIQLRKMAVNASMRYMVQPYVMSYFLDCPDDFPVPPGAGSGAKLRCPSLAQEAEVREAFSRGDLWLHAFPHNAEPELMDAVTFDAAGLDMAADLARRFKHAPPTVLSQRDVPGLTRGVVPLLAKRGVGISIGVNDGSPPPIVPSTVDCYSGYRQIRQPFLWVDEASNTSVVVDIHPGGYGGIVGTDPATGMPFYSRDGLLCDCIGVPGLDEALCYAWRGDNYGPADANETIENFRLFGNAFPNAEIVASTLDTYWEKLNEPSVRSRLPVETREIGDTWMYGSASAPRKVAAMRAMMRHFATCVKEEKCTAEQEPGLSAFKRGLIKLPEHTWAGCACAHMETDVPTTGWTAQELAAAREAATDEFYAIEEATYEEQRAFVEYTIYSLEKERADSPLAKTIRAEINEINRAPPTEATIKRDYDRVNYVDWGKEVTIAGYTLRLDTNTGAIIKLSKGSSEWANNNHPLARFVYRSHSYAENAEYAFSYNYNHGGEHPYHEPLGWPRAGMNKTTTIAKEWRGEMAGLWKRVDSRGLVSLLVELELNNNIREVYGYGAPSRAFVNISVALNTGEGLLVDVVWTGKVPSRLPESIWMEFRPLVPSDSRLLVDKMGSQVDVSRVVQKGGGSLHGVDPSGGVTFRTVSGRTMKIASMDSTLVAPGHNLNPWNFTAFDKVAANGSDGAAFNLFNNLYATNYILYYPWRSEEHFSRFRFRVDTDD